MNDEIRRVKRRVRRRHREIVAYKMTAATELTVKAQREPDDRDPGFLSR